MYLLSVDGILYGKRASDGQPSANRDALPFTLVEAMREVYGTRGAKIHRLNGEVVVRDAGSTVSPWVHVPSGRRIQHRATRWARERYQAEMRAQAERFRNAPMPALFAA